MFGKGFNLNLLESMVGPKEFRKVGLAIYQKLKGDVAKALEERAQTIDESAGERHTGVTLFVIERNEGKMLAGQIVYMDENRQVLRYSDPFLVDQLAEQTDYAELFKALSI